MAFYNYITFYFIHFIFLIASVMFNALLKSEEKKLKSSNKKIHWQKYLRHVAPRTC